MPTPRKQFKTIDQYIASFPKNTQTILEKIRQVIKESAPAAAETMKYGIPTFYLSENLVHFAGYKNHIGFYPTPKAILAFKKELSIYKQAKGSVQFPIDKPIPFTTIKKIVKSRVDDVKQKKSWKFIENHQKELVDGKKIIVTGGTQGIGRAIADELIKAGNIIAICGRTKRNIKKIKEKYQSIFTYCLDLADKNTAKKFIQKSIKDLGGLDILILNAAVAGIRDDSDYVYKVNETAQITMSKEASSILKKNKGKIIFITSAAKNIEGAETYGESKKRMETWLKKYAAQPENKDIHVFLIIPGSCNTRMHREVLKYGYGEAKSRTEDLIKKGKLRDPKTVGKIIAKMSLSGNKFDSQTKKYDIKINQGEVVYISDENIAAEDKNLIFT